MTEKVKHEYYIATDKGGPEIEMEYSFFLVAPDEELPHLAMPSGATYQDGVQVKPRKEYLQGK